MYMYAFSYAYILKSVHIHDDLKIRIINDYTVTQLWSNGLKFDIHKKEQEGYLYKSGTDKNIVGHSKLKFNNFFRGHDECECPSYSLSVSRKLKCIDFF